MRHWLLDVFNHPDPYGTLVIAAKTAAIYLFLIVGLRLLGKRELGQMTIYDLVLVIVLANSVQNAMVGSDTSLVGGIVAAMTLLILNRIFTIAVVRSRKFRHVMVGQPVLIVHDGKLLTDRMQREGVSRDQVMAALREHGIERLVDAHIAVLEVDGTISVVPQGAGFFRTRQHYRGLRMS